MTKKNKLDENFRPQASFFGDQVDEENLESARYFKKYLRFDIGQIVYLVSDIKRKLPMCISGFFNQDTDSDYVCSYTTSQKEVKREFFKDKELTL